MAQNTPDALAAPLFDTHQIEELQRALAQLAAALDQPTVMARYPATLSSATILLATARLLAERAQSTCALCGLPAGQRAWRSAGVASRQPACTDTAPNALIAELAEDLAAELLQRYGNTLNHPGQRARFDRDMAPVRAARAWLGEGSLP